MMSLTVKQGGDTEVAKPGTSKQTGNSAPKFDWEHNPIGRFARVFFHCVAFHVGLTDDSMSKNHKFGLDADYGYYANKCISWFGPYYNQVRKLRAKESGFTGRLEPFTGKDGENRVRYEFAKPGTKDKARCYGISSEHYASIKNQAPGGRMEVWTRCSEKIMKRLRDGAVITIEEATEWGK